MISRQQDGGTLGATETLHCRACERSGPKIGWSGAEFGVSVAENGGARSGRSWSGNGAGSGLNRPLTAHPTFHLGL